MCLVVGCTAALHAGSAGWGLSDRLCKPHYDAVATSITDRNKPTVYVGAAANYLEDYVKLCALMAYDTTKVDACIERRVAKHPDDATSQ